MFAQQTAHNPGKIILTEIFHDPLVHVSFEVNHANCFLQIKTRTRERFSQYAQQFQAALFDPYYEVSLNYSHSGIKAPIIWKVINDLSVCLFSEEKLRWSGGRAEQRKRLTSQQNREEKLSLFSAVPESPMQTFPQLSRFLSTQLTNRATRRHCRAMFLSVSRRVRPRSQNRECKTLQLTEMSLKR